VLDFHLLLSLGVQDKFLDHVGANPKTYANWSDGEWKQETLGKEDNLKSPYLQDEFQGAVDKGVISKEASQGLGVRDRPRPPRPSYPFDLAPL